MMHTTDAAPRALRMAAWAVLAAILALVISCDPSNTCPPSVSAMGECDPTEQALGRRATQVQISSSLFTPRLEHAAVVFKDRLFVIGGLGNGFIRYNDVWSSADGTTWTEETSAAAFPVRSNHAGVVFDGKLWVIGGTESSGVLKNDVWNSADGKTWTQVLAQDSTINGNDSGPQFSPRAGHGALVFNNKLWVIGGIAWTGPTSGTIVNDVWSSGDGKTWKQETPAAQFSIRGGFAAVVFENKMWVIGGDSVGRGSLNDVWWSENGTDWTEARAQKNPPGANELPLLDNPSGTVASNAIWVINTGVDSVWASLNGRDWSRAPVQGSFPAQDGGTLTAFRNRLWAIGGQSGNAPTNAIYAIP